MKAVWRGDEGGIGLDAVEGLVEVREGGSTGLLSEHGSRPGVDVHSTHGGEAAAVDGGVPVVVSHAAEADAQQTNQDELLVELKQKK